MGIEIRRAKPCDADKILELLSQVESVHHNGRPDIFREGGTKFTRDDLLDLMMNDRHPIFTALVDGQVAGYTFCIIREVKGSTMLRDAKTLHLEDVCVDASCRGSGIGGELIEYAKAYARTIGCDRIDLDVWEFNSGARNFYEKHGFATQKRTMDITL